MFYRKSLSIVLACSVFVSCSQKVETSDNKFIRGWLNHFTGLTEFEKTLKGYKTSERKRVDALINEYPGDSPRVRETKKRLKKMLDSTITNIEDVPCSFLVKATRDMERGNTRFYNPYFVVGGAVEAHTIGAGFSGGHEVAFALGNFQIASYGVYGKTIGKDYNKEEQKIDLAAVGANMYLGLGVAKSDIAEGGVHNAWEGFFTSYGMNIDVLETMFPAAKATKLFGADFGVNATTQIFFGGYEDVDSLLNSKINKDLRANLKSRETEGLWNDFSRAGDNFRKTDKVVNTAWPFKNKESAVGFTVGIGASAAYNGLPNFMPMSDAELVAASAAVGARRNYSNAWDLFSRVFVPNALNLTDLPVDFSFSTTFYEPQKNHLERLASSFNSSEFLAKHFPVNFQRVNFEGDHPYIRINANTEDEDGNKIPATYLSRAQNMANALITFFLTFQLPQEVNLDKTGYSKALLSTLFLPVISFLRRRLALIGAFRDLANSRAGAENYMKKVMAKCGSYKGDAIRLPYVTG